MSKLKDALSLFCKRSIVNSTNDKNDIHEISRKNIAMIQSYHRILSLYHLHIAGCFIVFFFRRFAFRFFFLLLWVKIGLRRLLGGVTKFDFFDEAC